MSGVSDLPPLLKAGDSVGPYILTAHIGSGPAAHAFRAKGRSKEVVAVRVLRPEFARDPAWAGHFLSASAALSQISHPVLGKVFETGMSDDVPYVVEEYLGLRHVIHLIFNEGIRQDQAISVLASVADLTAACDCASPPIRASGIRPTDVFLVEGAARVCHCGVLKSPFIEAAPGPARTSVPANQCLAPEVIAGEEPTLLADIYSLGLLFLRMLRGNWGVAAAVKALRLGTDIHQVIESIESPAIDDVLRRCLMPRPEDRFASAEELLDALMALRKGLKARGPRPFGQVLTPTPAPVPSTPPGWPAPEVGRLRPAAVTLRTAVQPPSAQPTPQAPESRATEATITVLDILAGTSAVAPGGVGEGPRVPRGRELPEAELAPALSATTAVTRLRALERKPPPLSMEELAELAAAYAGRRGSARRAEAPTERELATRYPAPRVAPRAEPAKPRRRMPGAFSKAPSRHDG